MTGSGRPADHDRDEQRALPSPYPDAYPDSSADNGGDGAAGPGGKPTTGRPTWQSALAIVIGIIVVLLFAYLHLSGAVGPGVH